jgi:type II secretory pathway component PulC
MKIVAGVIALLLLGLITYEWLSWPERYQQAVTVSAAEGKQRKDMINADPESLFKHQAEGYQLIAKRTLFRADRQGFETQQKEQPNQQRRPAVPKIRLLGIILTQGEPPSAMVMQEKSKKSRMLRVGDELGEWEILAIASDHLLISWQGQQKKIELRKF